MSAPKRKSTAKLELAGAARRSRLASGFTLIEILVVLALTLVMMSMFATIFSMTGTFVTKQKGIGENDQSARILTTVLKTDLEARTMRLLAPFHPNMTTASLGAFASNQQGYFYVSENDPTDDTDDVLQFTINMGATGLTQLKNPAAGTQLYGSALYLATPWQSGVNYGTGALVRPSTPAKNSMGFVFKNKGAAFTSGATEPTWPTTLTTVTDGGGTWTALPSPIDQPDGDDGVIGFDNSTPPNRTLDLAGGNPNNTGASQCAEVTYFLRHGNLYRRVLLLRQPYDVGSQTSAQPYDTDAPPASIILGTYPPYPPPYQAGAGSGNFWTDFDYSARIQPITGVAPATGVQYLGVGTVEGSLDNANAASGGIYVGRPDNRFGFDQTYNVLGTPPTTATTPNGAPREFAFQLNSATNSVTGSFFPAGPMYFFGRYTQEETSNPNFQFPGNLPVVGGTPTSPIGAASLLALDSASYTMWMLDANPPTTPLSLAGGPRRGEDILLTNVVGFDVKLWDGKYSETVATGDVNRNGVLDPGPAFADVGHTAASGDFLQSNNILPAYGPVTTSGYTVPAAPAPPARALWSPAFTRTFNGLTYNYNN